MSNDRLAFMRSLGITVEDVLDPSLINPVNDNTYKSTKKHLRDKYIPEVPLTNDINKTTRAIFLGAELPDSKTKPFQNVKISQHNSNEGRRDNLNSPEELKINGNRAFEEGKYREALSYYTDAIELLIEAGNYQLRENGCLKKKNDSNTKSGFATNDPRIMLLAALFSNRSACYLQAAKQIGSAEALESALRDADRAVELRPVWFKGYSRQGDAFFKMKKYTQACEAYEMALQFDPGNNNLLHSVREAKQRSLANVRENVYKNKKQSKVECAEGKAASDKIIPVTVPAPVNVSFNNVSNGRRDSGQFKVTARQLWNEFKPKLEASVQQGTGDDYRKEQLRLYREQKEREKNVYLRSPTTEFQKDNKSYSRENSKEKIASETIGLLNKNTSRKDVSNSIPQEFTADAAAAYQQRLLEEYRRKKAQKV